MSDELTLYDINTELLRLIEDREELEAIGAGKAEIDANELALREFMGAKLRKVDGCAYVLREFEKRQEAAEQEVDRLKARAARWKARRERLEAYIITGMQGMGETRLEGNANTLKIKKNPPAVEMNNINLVPESLLRRTVTLRENEYQKLTETAVEILKTADLEPIKSEILRKLKAGEAVAGCNLKTDSVRLEVE